MGPDFVPDPGNPVDELANPVRDSALDLLKQVVDGFTSVGGTSPREPWFLSQYAGASGIGLVIMAFMAILAVVSGMRSGAPRADLHESLFKYLPLAAFLLVFSPAIGVVLTEVVNGMTGGITAWSGGGADAVSAKLAALGDVTANEVPGGAFVGLLVFVLTVLGALGVIVALTVHKIGLPVVGIIAGLTWGMLIHPRWRARAVAIPATWLALLLVQPFLFLQLGTTFKLIDGSLGPGMAELSGAPLLSLLCLVAVALLVCAFAPYFVVRMLVRSRGNVAGRAVPAGAGPTVLGVAATGVVSRLIDDRRLPPVRPMDPTGRSREIERAYRDRRYEPRPAVVVADEQPGDLSPEMDGERDD